MFAKILLAYEGSDGSRLALRRTAEIARGAGEVLVLAVGRIPEYAETVSEVEEAKDQAGRHYDRLVEEAAAELRAAGIDAEGHVDFGKPGDVIVRHAEEIGADLIVMGTTPHSELKRRVLGATADKVVRRAHCSVLVVRPTTTAGAV
jgi:nucleotide-binding universal stress UspA family protein